MRAAGVCRVARGLRLWYEFVNRAGGDGRGVETMAIDLFFKNGRRQAMEEDQPQLIDLAAAGRMGPIQVDRPPAGPSGIFLNDPRPIAPAAPKLINAADGTTLPPVIDAVRPARLPVVSGTTGVVLPRADGTDYPPVIARGGRMAPNPYPDAVVAGARPFERFTPMRIEEARGKGLIYAEPDKALPQETRGMIDLVGAMRAGRDRAMSMGQREKDMRSEEHTS